MVVKHGSATIYHPKDGHSGSHVASCNGKDPKTGKYPCKGCFFVGQYHTANRTIPLNTSGYICSVRTGLCIRSVVRDRGPYGALLSCNKIDEKPKAHVCNGKSFLAHKIKWNQKCYWWQAQPCRLRSGWRYRGDFDLTKATAKAIGHKSFDKVVFFYYQKTKVVSK